MEKRVNCQKLDCRSLMQFEFRPNQHHGALITFATCGLLLLLLIVAAGLMQDTGLSTQLALRKLPPSWQHPFGTDWLGRDMLARTLNGLCLSLQIGLSAAAISAATALVLGMLSAGPSRAVDGLITGLVNLCMSMPHLVLLILISFVMGGGTRGVIVAVAASHWPRLTRIIRAEVLQLKTAPYVRFSAKVGKSPLWIAGHHMVPRILPQFFVGSLLLFPHAILHAAGLSFLGFGLSPHTPAIGVLLSESMRYLSCGCWWLAVMPGVTLVFTVKLFDFMGNSARDLLTPSRRHQ